MSEIASEISSNLSAFSAGVSRFSGHVSYVPAFSAGDFASMTERMILAKNAFSMVVPL